MMQQEKKIEEIKKRIIEGRIRSNDERIRKYNESKEKRTISDSSSVNVFFPNTFSNLESDKRFFS